MIAELTVTDELELRETQFAALPHPSKRNYRSLLNHLYKVQDICKDEVPYSLHPDQMVSLANNSDNSWLDSGVEAILDKIPHSERIFTPKHLRHKPEDPTHYYSKDRVEILSKLISVLLAATLLVIPIALLYELNAVQKTRLAMTLAFVIGFPILLATSTRSRQQEIFAVSAAYARFSSLGSDNALCLRIARYCAVLVVFLTNLQQPTQGNCNCSPTGTPKPMPSGRSFGPG